MLGLIVQPVILEHSSWLCAFSWGQGVTFRAEVECENKRKNDMGVCWVSKNNTCHIPSKLLILMIRNMDCGVERIYFLRNWFHIEKQ